MREASGSAAVTVVLPTFRRPEGLRRVLEALARQDDPLIDWELVVVDNDEPPGNAAVLEQFASGFPVPVRSVHEPKRGAAHARNRGIAEASSEFIAFIDDDVVPASDWLSQLLRPLQERRCDGVGGRVILDQTVRRPRWFDDRSFSGYLAHFNLGDDETDIEAGGYVLTANAAFRTGLLRESGGFDPVLGPRSGIPLVNDDVQLCRDAMRIGGKIRYSPSAVVVHELPPGRLTRSYIWRRLYAQGRSDWLLDRETLSLERWRGMAAALREFLHWLKAPLREGIWRRWNAYFVTWKFAFLLGFGREALLSFLGRRPAAGP